MNPAIWLSLAAVGLSATFGVVTLLMTARRDFAQELDRRLVRTEGDVAAIQKELDECKTERRELKRERQELREENFRLMRRLDNSRG